MSRAASQRAAEQIGQRVIADKRGGRDTGDAADQTFLGILLEVSQHRVVAEGFAPDAEVHVGIEQAREKNLASELKLAAARGQTRIGTDRHELSVCDRDATVEYSGGSYDLAILYYQVARHRTLHLRSLCASRRSRASITLDKSPLVSWA
ncbi:MAG TPA: hypothetical protein VMD75_11265 [Candidatus Binataceae bacterium]|nr:hypothetical protein [Candidatus Binataceae bacterium]